LDKVNSAAATVQVTKYDKSMKGEAKKAAAAAKKAAASKKAEEAEA